MKKRTVSTILCGMMAVGLLAGCGTSSEDSAATVSTEAVSETTEAAADAGTEENTAGDEEEITLHLFGPGLIASQGKDGALDMVTGLETPGYSVIEDRWNELHPNIHLDIQGAPWDSWQSAVQTAVLGGNVDIILHGASLTALCEPLDDYLAGDPDFAKEIYTTETRRTTDYNDLSTPTTTGIPYTLNAQICYLDKQIFDDYGVELPDEDWTWEDLLNTAQQLTGTDPVTGEQTYGVQLDQMDNANNMFFTYQMIASAYDAQVFHYGKTLDDSTVDFTNDKTIAVFQMIQDLAQYMSPETKEGTNVSYALTEDNNVAIRFSQNAFTHFNEAEVAKISDRFVFRPMPVIEEGEEKGNPSSFKGCNNMAICNTSKNKEAAWEFIKFMCTDPEAVQWVVDCGQIPNTPEGMGGIEAAMGDKADAIERALSTMPADFSNATTPYYDNNNFGPVTATLGVVVHDLVNDSTTAEKAAETMQKACDEYITAQ